VNTFLVSVAAPAKSFVVTRRQLGINPMIRQMMPKVMKGLRNHFMVAISMFDQGTEIQIRPSQTDAQRKGLPIRLAP